MDQLGSLIMAKALDGLDARYVATASNIANANTPGYRPIRVAFEAQLRAASAQGLHAVANVAPQTSFASGARFGDEPRIDLELATAAETAMRYSAMLDVLGRQMQIAHASISGGR